jgi:hypothetical protein
MPCAIGLRQHEHLERRAGLEAARPADRQVDARLPRPDAERLAAREREDLPVPGWTTAVARFARDPGPGGRRDGGGLHLRVHRRDDRQAAGLEQRLPAGLVRPETLVGEQLVQDVVAEVAVRAGAAGRRPAGSSPSGRRWRRVLVGGDVAELAHAVEHHVAALERVPRGVGRVERRGVLDDPGEQRRRRSVSAEAGPAEVPHPQPPGRPTVRAEYSDVAFRPLLSLPICPSLLPSPSFYSLHHSPSFYSSHPIPTTLIPLTTPSPSH